MTGKAVAVVVVMLVCVVGKAPPLSKHTHTLAMCALQDRSTVGQEQQQRVLNLALLPTAAPQPQQKQQQESVRAWRRMSLVCVRVCGRGCQMRWSV